MPDHSSDPTADSESTTTATPATARQRWAAIVTAPGLTVRDWSGLASAIAEADFILSNGTAMRFPNAPQRRGDEQWCRSALSVYPAHRADSTVVDTRSAGPGQCAADPDLIRAWLTAPDIHDSDGTVLFRNNPFGSFFAGQHVGLDVLEDLVQSAQDAGVFGAPEHHIELHHANPREFAISEAFASRNRSGGGA